MNKEELRAVLKRRRAEMSGDEVLKKSEAICSAVLSLGEFCAAQVVMVYLSFKNEVVTDMIIDEAIARGKTVTVPTVRGGDIVPVRIYAGEDLERGAFGIPEPRKKEPCGVTPDLCIVPGLGFSRRGGRIGFGKGYYDRYLSQNKCKTVGLAYSLQIEEEVFSEPHDVPIDIIVTEGECFFRE